MPPFFGRELGWIGAGKNAGGWELDWSWSWVSERSILRCVIYLVFEYTLDRGVYMELLSIYPATMSYRSLSNR